MREFNGYDLRFGVGAGTPTSPLMGNTIVVDQVYGNDATGAVGSLPFQTVGAAVSYLNGLAAIPAGGITVWVLPGSYTLSAGIVMRAGCSLRGLSTQTTIISWAASAPGATATLVTMAANSRVEDVTLTLTSANATTNLVGVYLSGAASDSSKLRGMVLNVNNSGLAAGATTNVWGIYDDTAAPLLPSDFSLNLTRSVTVNIYSNGAGSKRAVYIAGGSALSFRDTNFYVAAPTSPASTGSYVGVETNHIQALAAFRACSISGPTTAGGYTGSDVYQTLPLLRDTYGVSIGPGTDLIHRTTQGRPFALTTTPTILFFAINATLQAPPRYLWPGTLTTGGDTTEVFFRFDRQTLIQGMSVNMRTPPGAGHAVVFTVYKSATGVPGSGAPTPMTITISDLSVSGVNLNCSVQIAAGEYVSMRADRNNVGAADIAVQLDLY